MIMIIIDLKKKPFNKNTKQLGLLAIFSCMKVFLSSMHNKGFIFEFSLMWKKDLIPDVLS